MKLTPLAFYGKQGRGLADADLLRDVPALSVGTCSKALAL